MAQLATILFLFTLSVFAANQVDTAEIQWVICEPSAEVFLKKLEVKSIKPLVRDVYYAETHDLTLIKRGVFIRTRKNGSRYKTALKKRYENESDIPWTYMNDTESKCEWDYYGSNGHIGCSLYHKANSQADFISDLQKDFLKHEVQFSNFDQLKVLGPVQSREWSFDDFVVESITGPENWFNLKFSIRVSKSERAQSQAEYENWLISKQVNLCDNPRGQTEDLLKVLVQLAK